MPGTPKSDAELSEFLAKLAQFHATLSPNEQALLDELTAAALSPAGADVEGFTFNNMLGMQQVLLTSQNPTGRYYYYYRVVADQLNPKSLG